MVESGYPCLIVPCVTIVFASIEPRTAGAAKKQAIWRDADKRDCFLKIAHRLSKTKFKGSGWDPTEIWGVGVRWGRCWQKTEGAPH
jgi:hypothetical protein